MTQLLPTTETVRNQIAAFEQELARAASPRDAQAVRDRYLARKNSVVAGWMQMIAGAPAEQKKSIGRFANELGKTPRQCRSRNVGLLSESIHSPVSLRLLMQQRQRFGHDRIVQGAQPGHLTVVGGVHPGANELHEKKIDQAGHCGPRTGLPVSQFKLEQTQGGADSPVVRCHSRSEVQHAGEQRQEGVGDLVVVVVGTTKQACHRTFAG